MMTTTGQVQMASSQPSKRFTACLSCHELKIKCQARKPCRRCDKLGLECRLYTNTKRKKHTETADSVDSAAEESCRLVKKHTSLSTNLPASPSSLELTPLYNSQVASPSFETFSMLWSSITTGVAEGVIPTPAGVRGFLSVLASSMTRNQLSVLLEYISTLGDEEYRTAILAATESLHVVPIKYYGPENHHEKLDIPLDHLNALPLPVVYTQSSGSAVFWHCNDTARHILEYSASELANASEGGFPRIIAPDCSQKTAATVSLNLRKQLKRFSFSTALHTRTGRRIGAELAASVNYHPTGGYSMMAYFFPTPFATPNQSSDHLDAASTVPTVGLTPFLTEPLLHQPLQHLPIHAANQPSDGIAAACTDPTAEETVESIHDTQFLDDLWTELERSDDLPLHTNHSDFGQF